jgi:hypothetical protein
MMMEHGWLCGLCWKAKSEMVTLMLMVNQVIALA